jgi:transposase-like protein
MKRHDPHEIAAKLGHAEDMIKSGMSQKDVCKSLDISVMTFHRWRKLAASSDFQVPAPRDTARSSLGEDETSHPNEIEALKLENDRLRRIVSDLLLEKMKIQEALEKPGK